VTAKSKLSIDKTRRVLASRSGTRDHCDDPIHEPVESK